MIQRNERIGRKKRAKKREKTVTGSPDNEYDRHKIWFVCPQDDEKKENKKSKRCWWKNNDFWGYDDNVKPEEEEPPPPGADLSPIEDNDGQIAPDDPKYKFIKTISVAGSFKIRPRRPVFDSLTPGTRVHLFREYWNKYDRNAIRIKNRSGDKLGYVPREDAVEYAALIDKGTILTGQVKSAEQDSGQILVDIYERQLFPINDLTSFKFSSGGYFGHHVEFQIFFRTRKLIYAKTDMMDPGQEVILKFSRENWESFVLPSLQKCNFNAWNESYWNPAVCDGTQWELLLRKKGGKSMRISGSNAFPEEWKVFYKFQRECLDLNDIKGEGTFCIKPMAVFRRPSKYKQLREAEV